jgi:hypothetical protein
MVRHALVALSVSLAPFTSVALAHAEDPPLNDAQRRADALFFEARQLMAAGKYGEACPKLAEASRAHPGIGILLNLGDCDAHIGKVGSAWNAFHDAADAAQRASDEREKEARARMAELEPHLDRLMISVPPASNVAGLGVRLDGAPLDRAAWGAPMVVDPGMHTLDAQAPGRKPWTNSIEVLTPATSVTIPELELVAPPPAAVQTTAPAPTPSEQTVAPSGGLDHRTWALVAGGVGVVGVAVGSVFGILSMSHKSDGNTHCQLGPSGNECDPAGVQARSDAISTGNVSTIAYIVGAAGLAAGAVLWFTAPHREGASAPTVGIAAGLGAVQLRGAW